MKTDLSIQPGFFLIANPGLRDPNFFRSVVFIINHDSEGTFGIVVNQKSEVILSQVFPDHPGLDDRLYVGGPVQTDGLFILHRLGGNIPGSLQVGTGIYFGGDLEVLSHTDIPSEVLPGFRGFMGCAGWGPRQLEMEMAQGSWTLHPATERSLFDIPAVDMWESVLIQMGGKYVLYPSFPIDPRMN